MYDNKVKEKRINGMKGYPKQMLEMVNSRLGGLNIALGLKFTLVELDKLIAELTVSDQHKQPYGIVHGGVYSAMIETLCSTGAALNVIGDGRTAVGMENATSFLRAVRSGVLRCTAQPQFKGKRSHVWVAEVHDDRDRLVATGRVRLIVLEPGAEADGTKVGIQISP